MKRFLINIILFFVPFLLFYHPGKVFSINEETSNDARSVALGNVRALSHGLTNPAFIPFLNEGRIAASVYNRFQMSELNTSSLYCLFPNRILDAGIQLAHFGYEDYSVFALETGLAKKLSSKIAIGAKLLYINKSNFRDDPPESGFTAGIGFRAYLSPVVSIGILAENIAATFDGEHYSFHAGVDYQIATTSHILLELQSISGHIHIGIGSDYSITEQLTFRAGIHTNPFSPSLGAAYSFDHLTVGTTFLLHQVLGNSGIIEVSYSF